MLIFALLTYIGNQKNARKNKTNTDPNPTTYPNPKPTIDKAAKQKELNKVPYSDGFPVAKKYTAGAGCIDTVWIEVG